MKNSKEIKYLSKTERAEVAQYSAPRPALTYDTWFAQIVGSGRMKPKMKEPLRAHMKAYGFYEGGEFDNGLQHFGLKPNLVIGE
jgi:hypothetical protein